MGNEYSTLDESATAFTRHWDFNQGRLDSLPRYPNGKVAGISVGLSMAWLMECWRPQDPSDRDGWIRMQRMPDGKKLPSFILQGCELNELYLAQRSVKLARLRLNSECLKTIDQEMGDFFYKLHNFPRDYIYKEHGEQVDYFAGAYISKDGAYVDTERIMAERLAVNTQEQLISIFERMLTRPSIHYEYYTHIRGLISVHFYNKRDHVLAYYVDRDARTILVFDPDTGCWRSQSIDHFSAQGSILSLAKKVTELVDNLPVFYEERGACVIGISVIAYHKINMPPKANL